MVLDGVTLGERSFPQDESPGTSRLGEDSLLPMVMKTSRSDTPVAGCPLPGLHGCSVSLSK